jgi:hypothetical protein
MATRKASDSNLTGKKYNDASAGATKIPDLPQVPTSPIATGAAEPTVTLTPALRGGAASSYVIDNDFNGTTWSSSNTTVTATGLTPGTQLRFRVKAVNSSGESQYSGYTATVGVSGWALAQTFNSTANWTVPTGVTKIGVVVIGGGGNGASAGPGFNSGAGGRGAAAGGWYDYSVSSGTNYLVTVGAAGGTSSFGNLLSAGPNGTATTNVNTNAVLRASVSGGGGGSGLNGWAFAAQNSNGNIALSFPSPLGTQNFIYGGGGGGASNGTGPSYGGGSPYGGGAPGGSANGPGGGGGGATINNPNAFGAGGAGQVFVYTFTA